MHAKLGFFSWLFPFICQKGWRVVHSFGHSLSYRRISILKEWPKISTCKLNMVWQITMAWVKCSQVYSILRDIPIIYIKSALVLSLSSMVSLLGAQRPYGTRIWRGHAERRKYHESMRYTKVHAEPAATDPMITIWKPSRTLRCVPQSSPKDTMVFT